MENGRVCHWNVASCLKLLASTLNLVSIMHPLAAVSEQEKELLISTKEMAAMTTALCVISVTFKGTHLQECETLKYDY